MKCRPPAVCPLGEYRIRLSERIGYGSRSGPRRLGLPTHLRYNRTKIGRQHWQGGGAPCARTLSRSFEKGEVPAGHCASAGKIFQPFRSAGTCSRMKTTSSVRCLMCVVRMMGAMAAVALLLPAAGLVGAEKKPEKPAPAPAGLADLETVRQRLLEPLVSAPPGEAVRKFVRALRPDGSWPDVAYANRNRSGWRTTSHLGRLAMLAQAYKSPHSPLRGDPQLRKAVFAALDYWLDNDFRNSNWWWNQIGVPRGLTPTLLLLDDELSGPRRTKALEILGRARIGMTGQNLVWVTEVTAIRGVLQRDPELVRQAYRRIADEIRTDREEGIQPDFSFHQHGPCLYNHGYGAAFARDVPRIAVQVRGTAFAFAPEKLAILSGLILDGSQWMARGPTSDLGAEGREIARKSQDARYLAEAAQEMLLLPTGREAEFRQLAERAAGKPAPPLVGNRHFWCSDFMVHHRPGFYASARMYSRRVANTDQACNEEGLKNHHIADGCNLLICQGDEYDNIYPAWDWQKIPGTTVVQEPVLSGSPRRMGQTSFVGGVSDGRYGLAAFDFRRDALVARKAWCFFDDEFVCLGAGIACGSEYPVVTTVNQCRLRGQVAWAQTPGQAPENIREGRRALHHPAWVWHSGVGYVFLHPAEAQVEALQREGSWWEINHEASKAPVAVDLFCLWIDHGRRPEGAGYAYAVAPGKRVEEMPAVAATFPVKVLRNDADCQAVWHEPLGVAAAAFYRPGSASPAGLPSLSVDTPCLALWRRAAGGLSVSICNPENKPAKVTVELAGRFTGPGATSTEQGRKTRVVFELPNGPNAGQTQTRQLSAR